MAKIIDFKLAKAEKQNTGDEEDLNSLLKKAVILSGEDSRLNDGLAIIDYDGLKRIFQTRIYDSLIANRFIGKDYFFCGEYITRLLEEMAISVPESWFSVDYVNKWQATNNPAALKHGANICFLICSVFPERGEIRAMNLEDYMSMGAGLYYHYYAQTNDLIGLYMSRRYQPMAEITNFFIKKL